MNSREIIKRCIEFSGPERIGYDFMAPHPTDFFGAGGEVGGSIVYEEQDPEIRKLLPGFPGQLYRDPYGNLWGRLESLTKGEVVKGVLQDGWDRLDSYQLPDFSNPQAWEGVRQAFSEHTDKYRLGDMPGFPFAIMRYMRRMDVFLQDVLLHEKEVMRLNEQVEAMLLDIIDRFAQAGADGIFFCEDWGTQDRLLVSPRLWRNMFKPSYKVLSNRVHAHNMHLIMHSCGWIYPIIPDLIETSVDVLQLDQPELMGLERLAAEFGGKIAFYCPVDIQKVMQTGDKQAIQDSARRLIQGFGCYEGGFIAKDYPQWDAIEVAEEWAQWARDIFMGFSY
jgi:uroporphyrinogen decarboxylase